MAPPTICYTVLPAQQSPSNISYLGLITSLVKTQKMKRATELRIYEWEILSLSVFFHEGRNLVQKYFGKLFLFGSANSVHLAEIPFGERNS
jgi:hypothetical protein